MAVQPVPQGYGTVTPYLVIKGAARAMDWYKQVFDAEEVYRMAGPEGRIMHGEIRIGDSVLMVCDEFPEMEKWRSPETLGATTVALWIYSEDCDAIYSKAVSAGAISEMAPQDMFWGDRSGRFTDPFGHSWTVATHKEDLAPEEMARRQREFMTKMQENK